MYLKQISWESVDYFFWLKTGRSGELLWWRQWKFGFDKMRGMPSLAEELLTSRDEF